MSTATQRTLERFTARYAVNVTRTKSDFGAFYSFTDQAGAVLYRTKRPAEALAFCAGYEAGQTAI